IGPVSTLDGVDEHPASMSAAAIPWTSILIFISQSAQKSARNTSCACSRRCIRKLSGLAGSVWGFCLRVAHLLPGLIHLHGFSRSGEPIHFLFVIRHIPAAAAVPDLVFNRPNVGVLSRLVSDANRSDLFGDDLCLNLDWPLARHVL